MSEINEGATGAKDTVGERLYSLNEVRAAIFRWCGPAEGDDAFRGGVRQALVAIDRLSLGSAITLSVPIIPTDRMMIAGGFSFAGRVPNEDVFPEVRKIWDSMLRASQQAPAAPDLDKPETATRG